MSTDDDDIIRSVVGETFEEGHPSVATHQTYDERLIDAAQKCRDTIGKVTGSSFVTEAYTSATALRNVLGDADAFVAEQAENIRCNLLVLATELSRKPSGFILATARALPTKAARREFVSRIISDLTDYLEIIEGDDNDKNSTQEV